MNFQYIFFYGRYLPIIPLELEGQEWIELHAFVDSGASYSIFHADITEILGIDYEKGEETFMIVGDGERIPVLAHNINVRFNEGNLQQKLDPQINWE